MQFLPRYTLCVYRFLPVEENISIGFRPSFMIISGQMVEETSQEVCLATGDVNNGVIAFHINYVTIYPANGYFPQIDIKDRVYHYIAFR